MDIPLASWSKRRSRAGEVVKGRADGESRVTADRARVEGRGEPQLSAAWDRRQHRALGDQPGPCFVPQGPFLIPSCCRMETLSRYTAVVTKAKHLRASRVVSVLNLRFTILKCV